MINKLKAIWNILRGRPTSYGVTYRSLVEVEYPATFTHSTFAGPPPNEKVETRELVAGHVCGVCGRKDDPGCVMGC